MFVHQTSFFPPRNPFCRCSTDSMLLYFATVKRTIIHTAIARVHAYTHTHKICIHTLHTDTHIQIHTYRYTHNRHARTYWTHPNNNACPSMLCSTHVVTSTLSRTSSLTCLFPPRTATTTTYFTTTGGAVKHIPRLARRGSWMPWGRMEVRRERGGGGGGGGGIILTRMES